MVLVNFRASSFFLRLSNIRDEGNPTVPQQSISQPPVRSARWDGFERRGVVVAFLRMGRDERSECGI
jgi:hypothetical protein